MKKKSLLQQHQTILEKVVEDNSVLRAKCSELQEELARIKLEISTCRSETLRTIEPKMQELIQNHSKELEKQNTELQLQFEKDQISFNSQLEENKQSLEAHLESVENTYQNKIMKMKSIAEQREYELKSAYEKRLQKLPIKQQEAREKAENEESIIRDEWCKMIASKLQQELNQKLAKSTKQTKVDQDREIHSVVNKLEVDTADEALEIEQKIKRELKEHEIAKSRLKASIADFEADFQSAQADNENLDIEINQLSQQTDSCKCREYRKQILSLNKKIEDILRKIDDEKREADRIKLGAKEKQRNRISQLNEKLYILRQLSSDKRRDIELKLSQMDMQHRKNITIISERVKQTIDAKDQRIAELAHLLNPK